MDMSASGVVAFESLREADDQRSDHTSIAVLGQDALGLARLVDVLLCSREVAEAQVHIRKVGMQRGVEGANTLVTQGIGGLEGS